jgi:hypothetical protein
VAAVFMPSDLAEARRSLRALVMPGQRRLHMKKESDARRGTIIAAVAATGATCTIYNAGPSGRHELDARAACLRALVADVAADGHHMLVVEQDDSLLWWDRQHLIEITRDVGCRNTLRYEHRRAEQDMLLAVPDAIAWCWAKGGPWRDRVQTLVTEIRQI